MAKRTRSWESRVNAARDFLTNAPARTYPHDGREVQVRAATPRQISIGTNMTSREAGVVLAQCKRLFHPIVTREGKAHVTLYCLVAELATPASPSASQVTASVGSA